MATDAEIRQQIAELREALADPTLTVRRPDGMSITYRSISEILRAIAELENLLSKNGGFGRVVLVSGGRGYR